MPNSGIRIRGKLHRPNGGTSIAATPRCRENDFRPPEACNTFGTSLDKQSSAEFASALDQQLVVARSPGLEVPNWRLMAIGRDGVDLLPVGGVAWSDASETSIEPPTVALPLLRIRPVFVDDSGRRRKLVVLSAYSAAAVCVVFVAIVAFGVSRTSNGPPLTGLVAPDVAAAAPPAVPQPTASQPAVPVRSAVKPVAAVPAAKPVVTPTRAPAPVSAKQPASSAPATPSTGPPVGAGGSAPNGAPPGG
jgi:hypothetical protein